MWAETMESIQLSMSGSFRYFAVYVSGFENEPWNTLDTVNWKFEIK